MKQYLHGMSRFNRAYLWRAVIALVLIVLVVSGPLSCGKKTTSLSPDDTAATSEAPYYITGTLDTGDAETVLNETAPDAGGEITVNQPGSSIDGLSISIPEGAYTGTLPVEIAASPITSTTFKNINPVTPLISVDNGGGFAEELMTVRIPVTIPAGHFAMGFYYDEELQMLEAIPAVAMDGDSITLATCHFSDFFISTIENALLENPDIDSGFRLFQDNWQFPNPIVAFSAGICAGMSVSSIYYFYMKPDGPGRLYGRYAGTAPADAPATVWEDDKNAIRLASSVQADYEDSGTTARNQFSAMLESTSGNITVKEFAYAMIAMHGPQLVLLPRHAMVAVAVQNNNILICDPNFPNELRPTHWVNGQLRYFDGAADQPIEFMAMGALCPWKQVGVRWAEFKTGYPGADKFPADSRIYPSNPVTFNHLLNTDGTDLEITSGMYLPFNEISVFGAFPGFWHSWGGSLQTGSIEIYWKNQKTWEKRKGADVNKISLLSGANDIGVEWVATTGSGNYGSAIDGWLDFKWMTINYQPLEVLNIEPAGWSGKPYETKVFTVTSPTTLTGLRFRWLVNGVEVQNGPKQVYELNPDRATTYDITVEAWDDAAAKPYVLKTAAAIADTTGATVEPTWSPPVVDIPTIKITSHAEGDTITNSTFVLTVDYTFPNPEGGIITVTVTPTGYLENPNAVWSATVEVTNRSGTLTFEPEVTMGVQSGQLLVEAHISAPAVNLWGNDEYINLVIEIP